MKSNVSYLLAQSLSLVFYIITLIVYNRARKEYVGGKIAAAIKLIMVFLLIRLVSDFSDYFSALILPGLPVNLVADGACELSWQKFFFKIRI